MQQAAAQLKMQDLRFNTTHIYKRSARITQIVYCVKRNYVWYGGWWFSGRPIEPILINILTDKYLNGWKRS